MASAVAIAIGGCNAADEDAARPKVEVDAGTSSMGPFQGGRCHDNRAVSGPCASYGDQCTYDEADTGTHFCTCLVSSPGRPGLAGWSCH